MSRPPLRRFGPKAFARDVPSHLEADAKVGDYLGLAEKAIGAGKFDKATAYTLLVLAWQTERKRAEA